MASKSDGIKPRICAQVNLSVPENRVYILPLYNRIAFRVEILFSIKKFSMLNICMIQSCFRLLKKTYGSLLEMVNRNTLRVLSISCIGCACKCVNTSFKTIREMVGRRLAIARDLLSPSLSVQLILFSRLMDLYGSSTAVVNHLLDRSLSIRLIPPYFMLQLRPKFIGHDVRSCPAEDYVPGR